MLGTLGLALILLGFMFNLWKTEDARVFRLPTGTRRVQIEWFCNSEGKSCVFDARITCTQILAVVFALAAGINTTTYKLWAWALASFMTGIAGGLLAGHVKSPSVFPFIVEQNIILIAVVVMGGVVSLWGGHHLRPARRRLAGALPEGRPI